MKVFFSKDHKEGERLWPGSHLTEGKWLSWRTKQSLVLIFAEGEALAWCFIIGSNT